MLIPLDHRVYQLAFVARIASDPMGALIYCFDDYVESPDQIVGRENLQFKVVAAFRSSLLGVKIGTWRIVHIPYTVDIKKLPEPVFVTQIANLPKQVEVVDAKSLKTVALRPFAESDAKSFIAHGGWAGCEAVECVLADLYHKSRRPQS